MSRGKGARKPCGVQQARQRLVDARQFLEAAELLDSPDVVATCAIHAAIAAADARWRPSWIPCPDLSRWSVRRVVHPDVGAPRLADAPMMYSG